MTPANASIPADRLRTYASFVRFEHTLFSLPLILAGVFSVGGPSLDAWRWLLIAVAAVASSSVAGKKRRMSAVTGCEERTESPRSPLSASVR